MTVWTLRFDKRAAKDLSRLPKADQKRIIDFLELRVAHRQNPRELGQALTGPLAGLWRYRVGSFRVIARIDDSTISVWVIQVGNRREVYR